MKTPAHKDFRLGARAIYERLRDQIVAQVYAAGEEISSSRALAKELGVSRTTICVAYEQLAAEGYILVSQGARPRVAGALTTAQPSAVSAANNANTSQNLSQYGQRLGQIGALPQPSPKGLVVNFRYGEVAAADFPQAAWRRAMTDAVTRQSGVLAYGAPQGSEAIRRALQGYLWRARSINCDMDQIILVSGSQQALDLVARLLLDPQDHFVIENPAYAMARLAFEMTGAQGIPIAVDSLGLDTSLLRDVAARLAYVTPSHQYPLGGVMPIERRLELISWAQRSNAWIVEDDYDSEFRYDVKPLPPLWAINQNDRVIYIGTISKILSPSLRIGYVVVPDALRGVMTAAKQLTDRHSSQYDQDALASLIQSGAYERHIRRQRRLNQRRRETLIEALRSSFGARVDVEGTQTGLHVVVWFRDLPAAQEGALIEAARRLGVGVYSVRPLCMPPLPAPRGDQIGLVIGYAALDPEWITQGIRLLRRAVDEMRPIPSN